MFFTFSHYTAYNYLVRVMFISTFMFVMLQIIMAKPAGGPKVKDNKNWDEDD